MNLDTAKREMGAVLLGLAAFALPASSHARAQQGEGRTAEATTGEKPGQAELQLIGRSIEKVFARLSAGLSGRVEVVNGQTGPFFHYPRKVSVIERVLKPGGDQTELNAVAGAVLEAPSSHLITDAITRKDPITVLMVENDSIGRARGMGALKDAGASVVARYDHYATGDLVYRAEGKSLGRLTIMDGPAKGRDLLAEVGGHQQATIVVDRIVDPAPHTVMQPNPARAGAQQHRDACRANLDRHERDWAARGFGVFVPIFGWAVLAQGERIVGEARAALAAAEGALNATPGEVPVSVDPAPYVAETKPVTTLKGLAASADPEVQRLLDVERRALEKGQGQVPESVLLYRVAQRLIEEQNARQLTGIAEALIADPQMQGVVRQLAVARGQDPEQTQLRVSRFIRELSEGLSTENAPLIREALRARYAKEKDPEARRAQALELALFDQVALQLAQSGGIQGVVGWENVPVSMPAREVIQYVVPKFVEQL